ncbi:MAG TPA: MFS transporter, partial [Dehalococcoidia bacterium]|nr:MFS transporter [Dehalococcoidia bacterium]
PAIVLNLVGGVLADKLEQRRLIMLTQSIVAAAVFMLATLTALDRVEMWHVLMVAFTTSAISPLEQPARHSVFPHLLERRDLPQAVALNSVIWQGTRIIAPAIGGLIIAASGPATAFYLCFAGFAIMALTMVGLKVPPMPRSQGRVIDDMKEGINFILHNSVFAFLISMTFFNSFFGMSYLQLLPVFAVDILDVGSAGLGIMMSMGGVGSFLGIFVASALWKNMQRGSLIIMGAALFGGSLAAFAFSEWFAASLAILFIIGVFNAIYMISIQTSLQTMVPDELRGRVMGIYGMTWNIQPLGVMQAGLIASVFSAPLAVAVGGLAVAGFALGIASTNVRIRQLGVPAAEPAQ